MDAAAATARAPFAWHDGPLLSAMRGGDMILVDEINLAEVRGLSVCWRLP
jgi:midasin